MIRLWLVVSRAASFGMLYVHSPDAEFIRNDSEMARFTSSCVNVSVKSVDEWSCGALRNRLMEREREREKNDDKNSMIRRSYCRADR